MHPLLAGTVGEFTRWLGTELFPFLIALLLNLTACLAVLTAIVFVLGVLAVLLCSTIDAITNHAADSESPQQQTGDGSPTKFGEGSPKP